jgi:hypothetical protein
VSPDLWDAHGGASVSEQWCLANWDELAETLPEFQFDEFQSLFTANRFLEAKLLAQTPVYKVRQLESVNDYTDYNYVMETADGAVYAFPNLLSVGEFLNTNFRYVSSAIKYRNGKMPKLFPGYTFYKLRSQRYPREGLIYTSKGEKFYSVIEAANAYQLRTNTIYTAIRKGTPTRDGTQWYRKKAYE